MNTTLLQAVEEQQVWAAKQFPRQLLAGLGCRSTILYWYRGSVSAEWIIDLESFLLLSFFIEVAASVQSLVYILHQERNKSEKFLFLVSFYLFIVYGHKIMCHRYMFFMWKKSKKM
jgi:hypothetical protein